MGINQSINFGCFHRGGVSPEEVIMAAARIGYKSVEMLDRKYWDMVKDNGLEIAIIIGHSSLPDGLNKRENHARIEDELLANIELAEEYNIPALITFSGNREGKSDVEGRDNTAEGHLRVAKAAEEKGVTLCMELLNSKVDHQDYQCDYTPWGVEVCELVNSSHVKLLYDIYHMQIMEGDMIRTIRDNVGHIGHFHTAGNPGRNDLDGDQEIHYPAVMRAVSETGYTAYVGHEFIPKGHSIAAMEAAFSVCDV